MQNSGRHVEILTVVFVVDTNCLVCVRLCLFDFTVMCGCVSLPGCVCVCVYPLVCDAAADDDADCVYRSVETLRIAANADLHLYARLCDLLGL